jgi:hopene-associated glycosyltransferase HpnB
MLTIIFILQMLTAASVIIWFILIIFRGQFWRADQYLPDIEISFSTPPEIVIIIPARNEEQTIGHCISSLLQQDYKGTMSIIIINDSSNDNTLAVVKSASQGCNNIHLINGAETPSAWTGKLWAMAQGVEFAKKTFCHADYYLFTDSDILHHPKNITELATKATNENLALVSLMVKLRCISIWETLLMPAFIFFFQKLYPFSLVNNPKKSNAAAAGGCMLVNCQDLEKAGGLKEIKAAIIDDCALAILLKQANPIWLGLTQSTKSLRKYQSLSDISRMVSRTAFVQLNYSVLNLFFVIIGMLIIYTIPLVSILIGVIIEEISLFILGLMGWMTMFVAYVPTITLYNRPIWEASFLPISALLYSAMTAISAWQYTFGRGPIWKGRSMTSVGKHHVIQK